MRVRSCLAIVLFVLVAPLRAAPSALVLQTDFGLKDGAVAAMKGVAFSVSASLPIFDLSHENTPYDIWQGAYRLKQAVPYWPKGTVFVSVIDPGVGTERKSVVVKSETGHYFVGPDNGTWTWVAEDCGVAMVRQIDETRNRLVGSNKSYTFHGRDVYVFTGARLASGAISFDEVGPELPATVVSLPYTRATAAPGAVVGSVAQLDFQFGNVWTNIPDTLFSTLKPALGDRFRVTIKRGDTVIFKEELPYLTTFGEAKKGEPLLYLNSLLNLSIALNQGDFARKHHIEAGADWSVRVEKIAK